MWLGTDLSLSRQVAVKLLKPNLASDPIVAERFRREAIAVAQLNHPNIVAVYDAIEDNGRQAVVMQLINGKSLRQLLDEQKKLSPDLTIHIGSCVASALDAAHQAGMVHRDVKPGNILITPDGRVLLTDFGIAKGLEPTGDDLTNDVKGAKALGLHTAWIAPRASVVDPAVDIHLRDLAELPAHCARVFA